jgi:hypothetical protein
MSTGGTIENRRLDKLEQLDFFFQRLSWFFLLISVGIVLAASVDWINGQHRYVPACVALSLIYRHLSQKVRIVMDAERSTPEPNDDLQYWV